MKIVNSIKSSNNITTKFLQSTDEGEIVETVVIERPEKRIVCFSTQIGCSMSCSICAVSKLGFVRNLTTEQLIQQCLNVTNNINRPTLFSAMGTGEPMLNHHLVPTFQQLSQHGRLAVSTIGINPKRVKQFSQQLKDTDVKIQLSVHAPTDELRRELLDKRLPSLRETLDIFSQLNHRVEYNYTLLSGVNDSDKQAEQLANLLKDCNGVVKFNKYNPIVSANYIGSTKERIQRFISIINQHDLQTETYATDGTDIDAACGQLTYFLKQV